MFRHPVGCFFIGGENMELRVIPIDHINAAAYKSHVDLQPGDVEYEKLRRSIKERTYWAYGRRSSAIQENGQ